MSYVRRRQVVAELAALLFWAVATAAIVLGIIHHALDLDDVRRATCQEDEPCWDCETMGNEVCGRP